MYYRVGLEPTEDMEFLRTCTHVDLRTHIIRFTCTYVMPVLLFILYP